MKKNNPLPIVVLLIIVIVAGFLIWKKNHPMVVVSPPDTTTTGGQTTVSGFDKSISDGVITAVYPSKDFGLATNATQVLTKSYIPPCSEGFDYCLYYIGTAYAGSNFESAGIRIQKRADLSSESMCLDTPPDGFDASTIPSKTTNGDTYSTSIFSSIGDAAAGHSASGTLYRLFDRSDSSCREFETRIGQTQYANYPAGTIQEFTADDQSALKAELDQIVSKVTLSSGQTNLWVL